MGLSRADRRTLLRLMADECYQQTKLGAAFLPHKQQRSSLFWQLAASYLEQPLMVVMLAGMSLRAEADALWHKQREQQRQRHRRQQGRAALGTPAAPTLPRPQPPASTPAADKVLPTPAIETDAPVAGGSSGGGKHRPRKDKGERRQRRAAATAAAAAAAASDQAAAAAGEGSGSGQARKPPSTAEAQLPPAAKKRKRKEAGSGSEAGAPAGPQPARAAGAPAQRAAAVEPQQPAAKKRRRQEAGGGSAAEAQQQAAVPYDPFSGASAAFRPQEVPAAAAMPAAPAAPTVGGPAAAAAPAATTVAAAAAAARPPSAKQRWRPEADAELLLLASSTEQRQRVLGSAELDWGLIGAHSGRSARAAQAHYHVLIQASGAKPTAGSAAAPAAAAGGQRGEEQQVAARRGHSMPEAEAGQLFSRNSGAAPQPVRAAITIGLPPQAEQHERPPFVGVTHDEGRHLPWGGKAKINGKAYRLGACASRAGAAAAHDVARIWCKLHGQEVGKTGNNVNFPQLLEDRQLEQQLRGLADVPALKTFLATWLVQRWPQLEAAMLAGRAAALDRFIAATSKRMGVSLVGKGWQAQIRVLGKQWALGTWPSVEAAGVVRDVGSVWRGLHASSAKASQLYNHPQLRLWEDAALLASLRRIQSREQLQGFVKGWAQQHLPAMLARLAQQGAAAAAVAAP